jgi:hypothetical protein
MERKGMIKTNICTPKRIDNTIIRGMGMGMMNMNMNTNEGERRREEDNPRQIWNMDTLPSYTLALADVDDVIFVVIGLMGSGNMSKSVIMSTYASSCSCPFVSSSPPSRPHPISIIMFFFLKISFQFFL